jgi:hypothetical protein
VRSQSRSRHCEGESPKQSSKTTPSLRAA